MSNIFKLTFFLLSFDKQASIAKSLPAVREQLFLNLIRRWTCRSDFIKLNNYKSMLINLIYIKVHIIFCLVADDQAKAISGICLS